MGEKEEGRGNGIFLWGHSRWGWIYYKGKMKIAKKDGTKKQRIFLNIGQEDS